jgi:hypothetical protein
MSTATTTTTTYVRKYIHTYVFTYNNINHVKIKKKIKSKSNPEVAWLAFYHASRMFSAMMNAVRRGETWGKSLMSDKGEVSSSKRTLSLSLSLSLSRTHTHKSRVSDTDEIFCFFKQRFKILSSLLADYLDGVSLIPFLKLSV